MRMGQNRSVCSAIISIIAGVLLIVMKGEVINLVLTVIGIGLLVLAVLDLVHRQTRDGIIKAVLGVCVLSFGWLFVNLALYVLAIVIIVMGVMQIVETSRYALVGYSFQDKFLLYLQPVATVLAGLFLLFNRGGAISWMFIVTGLLLVVEGILDLVSAHR